MEETNYIALAVPAFFLLIAVEFIVLARKRQLDSYRFDDSITNLSCGIGQQVTGILMKTAMVGAYAWVFDSHSWSVMEASSVWPWIIAFFGVDCAYYWWHRASHRINFLWAVHVVHHQSEEYNLSVALRQAWFSTPTSLVFYLPLALIGVPPIVFATILAFSTLYQFWIHTRAIGRMPIFEWVFNAPSHHRVHHAINPKYLDRNYAATLIIWDRLFGTFKDEEEEPAYGTVTPFASWNPIWANFHYWAKLAKTSWGASGFIDKIKIWLMPPEWQPHSLGGAIAPPETTRQSQVKYRTTRRRELSWYVALHFLPVALVGTMLTVSKDTGLGAVSGLVATILLTTWIWGGLFEGKPWAQFMEMARLIGLAVVAVIILGMDRSSPALATGAIALLVASGIWLLRHRDGEAVAEHSTPA